MSYQTINTKEAGIFTCLVEAICAPDPIYPAVEQTSAVSFFDHYVASVSWANSFAIRLMFKLSNFLPLVLGFKRRLTNLTPPQRGEFTTRWSESNFIPLKVMFKLVKSITGMAYYGDELVLKTCGYDSEANVERGLKLRQEQGRH